MDPQSCLTPTKFRPPRAKLKSLHLAIFRLNVDFSRVSHCNSASFHLNHGVLHHTLRRRFTYPLAVRSLAAEFSPIIAPYPAYSPPNVDFSCVSTWNPASSRFFCGQWMNRLAVISAARHSDRSPVWILGPRFQGGKTAFGILPHGTGLDPNSPLLVLPGLGQARPRKIFVNFTPSNLQPGEIFPNHFSVRPSPLHFTPKKSQKIRLTDPFHFCTIAPNPNVD